MDRRRLLQLTAGGALALPFIGASCAHRPGLSRAGRPLNSGDLTVLDKDGLIGGKSLKDLHDRYVFDLFDDFVPYVYKHAVDHEYGGFMTHADRAGNHVTTNKNATGEGRGIWTFSYLYRTLAQEEKYIEVARKSIDFIMKNEPEGDMLWPFTFNREGEPLRPPGDHTESIYRDLFIAEGLAVYGQATDQPEYWEKAKGIIQKALRLYDRPDYAPTKPFVYVEDNEPFPGGRILGVPMVLLRTTSQMLEYHDDPEIKAINDRCMEEILGPFVNPEWNLMNEVLSHDYTVPDNQYGAVAYTGHALETLWMVLYEAHRRRDRGLFDEAAAHVKRHAEVSWDYVYGGWFRGCQDVDANVWFLDKAAWVQEETLIGLLFIIEHTGAQWAKEWYTRAYSFVLEKYPLAQHGYALWDVYPDRWVTFVEDYNRIEHFHHPRHLMLALETIKRMMARDGRVSGDLG